MQKKKKIIIIGVSVLVLIGGVVFAFSRGNNTQKTVISKVTAQKGNISNTISGSGTVNPIEDYTIVTTVTGEILSDNVEIGQEYKKGDLLYVIDNTDAKNNITKAQNSLEKQKMSYEQAIDNVENLTLKAPFSGRIANLYVEEGDSINNGTKIADLVDSNTLTVKLPFLATDAKYINKGNTARVYLELLGEEIEGTVENVATGKYTNSYGAIVTDVEISFKNPGNLLSGELVSATVGNYACNSTGTANYKNETVLTSKTSGTIEKLNFSNGDLVNNNDVILTIENDSTLLSKKSAQLSLNEAQISLEEANEAYNDCTVTSPIDGTVTYKYYKAGDELTRTESTTLAVIADMSKLSFEMSIDELDIKSIALGQKVIVTADALTGQEFEGEITNISIVGSASSGVTTYPVTVVISDYDGLLPGMNVTAEIVSEEVTDVVMVPTSAVSRGDVVLVKEDYANSLEVNKNKTTDENSENQKNKTTLPGEIVEMRNTPEGYKYIKVTTGLSSSDYIEIKEGLSEGAEVYVISTVTENSSSSSSSSSSGMFGQMGGGASMGSMPMGDMGGGSFPGGGGGGNFSSGGQGGNRGGMPGGR